MSDAKIKVRFVVDIQLGNAAMLTGADVARLLFAIGETVEGDGDLAETRLGYGRKIRDLNGNTVGSWVVTDRVSDLDAE